MARSYRLGFGTRLVNWVFTGMTRAGVGASYRHILTVRGRRTGRLRSTPVDVIEVAGHRWLVAGYGMSSWALNARAAGEVALRRGRRSQRYSVTEPVPSDAVPVLRRYMAQIRVTRPYFDAAPDSPDDAIKAELPRHPVFELTPVSPAGPSRVLPPAQADLCPAVVLKGSLAGAFVTWFVTGSRPSWLLRPVPA